MLDSARCPCGNGSWKRIGGEWVCARCGERDGGPYTGALRTNSAPKMLTGDCSIDCEDRCAYPGQFSECEMGAVVAAESSPTFAAVGMSTETETP